MASRYSIVQYVPNPITDERINIGVVAFDDNNDFPVRGSHKKHKFDAVVANGQPYFAAHGISFEVQIPESLQDSLSWMIADVKESDSTFPIGIVALPPKQEWPDYEKLNKLYKTTISTYRSLGAEVLQENEVQPWASYTLDKLVAM